MASKTNLSQKALKSRVRLSVPDTRTRMDKTSFIWIGTNPVDPLRSGRKGRKSGSGYRVGKHFFDGAFVATFKSGHTGLYRRQGKARLKLEEVGIPVDSDVHNAVRLLNIRAQRDLQKRVKQELNWELQKLYG